MNQYEIAVLYHPDLEVDLSKAEEKVTKLFTSNGGKVVHTDNWGKRKLAFPIGKATEGRYVFLYVVAEDAPPPVAEVEMRLNQNERVMRYLWVRTDEDLRRAMRKGKRSFAAAEAVGITGPLRGGGLPRERSAEEVREA